MGNKTRNGIIGLIGTAMAVTGFASVAQAQEKTEQNSATVFQYDPYQRYGQNERRFDGRYDPRYQDDRYYGDRRHYPQDRRNELQEIACVFSPETERFLRTGRINAWYYGQDRHHRSGNYQLELMPELYEYTPVTDRRAQQGFRAIDSLLNGNVRDFRVSSRNGQEIHDIQQELENFVERNRCNNIRQRPFQRW